MKTFVLAIMYLSISAAAYSGEPQGVDPSSTGKAAANAAVTAATPENPGQPPVMMNDEDLKAGMQHYRDRKYAAAISALSRYATIAPKSQQRTASLLIIGKSLAEMNQHSSALNLYGRVTAEDPESPESLLGVVAMADIGLSRPELNYRSGKKWSEYFTDPVKSYNAALSKKVPLSIIEHIYHQRGRALWKSKRYEEAHLALTAFLKKYPQTAYREETVRILSDCTAFLIDQLHQAGDDLAVADLYMEGWKAGFIRTADVDTLLKSALSLSRIELYEESLKLLTALRKNPAGKPPAPVEKIDAVIAEIEKNRKRGPSEQTTTDPRWAQFQSARERLSANQPALAEQTLTELRGTGADLFWAKIAEYALEESRWAQKIQGRTKP